MLLRKIVVSIIIAALAWGGWRLGARTGFMTAYFCACLGSALGLFWGRKLARALFD